MRFTLTPRDGSGQDEHSHSVNSCKICVHSQTPGCPMPGDATAATYLWNKPDSVMDGDRIIELIHESDVLTTRSTSQLLIGESSGWWWPLLVTPTWSDCLRLWFQLPPLPFWKCRPQSKWWWWYGRGQAFPLVANETIGLYWESDL